MFHESELQVNCNPRLHVFCIKHYRFRGLEPPAVLYSNHIYNCGWSLSHWRKWLTWLWHLTLILSDVGYFHWQLWRLVTGLYFFKNPCFITSDESIEKVWFSLKKNSRWCPDSPAGGAPSNHHSAILAPVLRIHSTKPKYSLIIFQIFSFRH